MARSRVDQLVDRLRQLQASTPDIEASALVSVDGLIMASALPEGVEDDRVSAMSAAMLSLGERIAQELQRGELEQVYLPGFKGKESAPQGPPGGRQSRRPVKMARLTSAMALVI